MRVSTRDTSDLASEQAAEVRAKVTPNRDRAVALFRVSLEIARSLALRQRPEFSRRIKIQVQVESTWVLKDTSSPRGFLGESHGGMGVKQKSGTRKLQKPTSHFIDLDGSVRVG